MKRRLCIGLWCAVIAGPVAAITPEEALENCERATDYYQTCKSTPLAYEKWRCLEVSVRDIQTYCIANNHWLLRQRAAETQLLASLTAKYQVEDRVEKAAQAQLKTRLENLNAITAVFEPLLQQKAQDIARFAQDFRRDLVETFDDDLAQLQQLAAQSDGDTTSADLTLRITHIELWLFEERRRRHQTEAQVALLRHSLARLDQRYQAQIAPYLTFMAEEGISALQSHTLVLDEMTAYLAARRDTVAAQSDTLLASLQQKWETLSNSETQQAVTDALQTKIYLERSIRFLTTANALVHDFQSPTTSGYLRLPYYGEWVERAHAVIEAADACDGALGGSWQQAGCEKLTAFTGNAARFLTQQLAFGLQLALNALDQHPDNPQPDTRIHLQSLIAAGELATAAVLLDGILREIDA